MFKRLLKLKDDNTNLKLVKRKDENLSWIDNSDKAVSRRLTNLRIKLSEASNRYKTVIDKKVVETPRKIEWEYKGYQWTVGYSKFDLKHYKHIPEFRPYAEKMKLREEASGFTLRKADGRPYTLEEYMQFLLRTKESFYAPYDLLHAEKENIIIPYHFTEIHSWEDFSLPKELKEIGLDKNSWEAWLDWGLDGLYWEGKGETSITEREFSQYDKKGTEMASYNLRVEPVIEVTINGIKAYSFNLTVTEKEKIIEEIRSNKQLGGSFISDGKEDITYVKRHERLRNLCLNVWEINELSSNVVNNLSLYKERGTKDELTNSYLVYLFDYLEKVKEEETSKDYPDDWTVYKINGDLLGIKVDKLRLIDLAGLCVYGNDEESGEINRIINLNLDKCNEKWILYGDAFRKEVKKIENTSGGMSYDN